MQEPRPRREYRRYDPMDEIFAGSGFRFQYSDRDITLFHKLSITTRFDFYLSSLYLNLDVGLYQWFKKMENQIPL